MAHAHAFVRLTGNRLRRPVQRLDYAPLVAEDLSYCLADRLVGRIVFSSNAFSTPDTNRAKSGYIWTEKVSKCDQSLMNGNPTSVPRHSIVSISVRALSSADAQSYQSVRLLALHEQPPAFGSLPEDEPNLSEIATRLTESGDRCFFGALQDERLIGIVRISRYCASNEKHRAYLGGLYVLPTFRRGGCGRLLVKQALSWAANMPNIRRVNLTVVTQQKAAICLYQSLGFRIYGTEQETFSKTGCFYDEYLMTLELTSENNCNPTVL